MEQTVIHHLKWKFIKYTSLLFETSRWLLILLFVYTGLSKITGHSLFLQQLSKVPLLADMAGFIAVAIPLAELAAAGSLVWVKTEITGWWISSILLSSFSIYIGSMLLFAPHLPCSCGGIVAALSWKQHLLINLSLAIIAWLKLYQHYFIVRFRMHARE